MCPSKINQWNEIKEINLSKVKNAQIEEINQIK